MERNVILVACRVFAEEIAALMGGNDELAGLEVVWVDAGLHNDLALLEKELSAAIDRAKSGGEGDVRVFFGLGCLPGMDSLAQEKGVAISSVKNCISAFLGDDKARELEQNRTMIMTPGWIRIWPDGMRRILGWDEVDFRMNLGRYDRILVVDAGINPLTDEEIMEFFDLVQVPLEVEAIGLDHFDGVLKKLLG